MTALIARVDWRHVGLILLYEFGLFLHLCGRLALLVLVIAAGTVVTLVSLILFRRWPRFVRDLF